MKRILPIIFAMTAALAVLTGCQTDYTKSAVERARTYALKNLKGLSDNQRNFIRYTQPEIYENIVYPRYVTPLDAGASHIEIDDVRHFPVAPEHDLMHSCVVSCMPVPKAVPGSMWMIILSASSGRTARTIPIPML